MLCGLNTFFKVNYLLKITTMTITTKINDSKIIGIPNNCIVSRHEGPLCSVCSPGYFKLMTACHSCPSTVWMVGQSLLFGSPFCFWIPLVEWQTKG